MALKLSLCARRLSLKAALSVIASRPAVRFFLSEMDEIIPW